MDEFMSVEMSEQMKKYLGVEDESKPLIEAAGAIFSMCEFAKIWHDGALHAGFSQAGAERFSAIFIAEYMRSPGSASNESEDDT